MQDSFSAEENIERSFELSDIVLDVFREDFEEIEIQVFSFVHQFGLEDGDPRFEIRRFDVGDES